MALFLEVANLLYEGPWVSERTAALRTVIETTPDILFPVTRAILEAGLRRLTVDAFDAFHLLQQARRQAELLFAEYDALLLPTAPFCPTLAEVAADPLGPNRRLGTFTNFANLCDMAAFAVPIGRPAIGGVLLGPAWSEGRLAAAGRFVAPSFRDDRRCHAQRLPPPAEPNPLEANETALFCIGAHMSGLPLNWQLTAVGGRFLRETQTQPVYRLFALGNRPGHGPRGGWRRNRRGGLGVADRGDRRPARAGASAAGLRDGDAGRWPLPRVSGRVGWRRGCDRHHSSWRLARLAAIEPWRLTMDEAAFGRLDRCRNRGAWDQNESRVEARGAHASGDLPRSCRNRSADAAR